MVFPCFVLKVLYFLILCGYQKVLPVLTRISNMPLQQQLLFRHESSQAWQFKSSAAVDNVTDFLTNESDKLMAKRHLAENRCNNFNQRLFATMKILTLAPDYFLRILQQFDFDRVNTVELELVNKNVFYDDQRIYSANASLASIVPENSLIVRDCTPSYVLRVALDNYSLFEWTKVLRKHFIAVRRLRYSVFG